MIFPQLYFFQAGLWYESTYSAYTLPLIVWNIMEFDILLASHIYLEIPFILSQIMQPKLFINYMPLLIIWVAWYDDREKDVMLLWRTISILKNSTYSLNAHVAANRDWLWSDVHLPFLMAYPKCHIIAYFHSDDIEMIFRGRFTGPWAGHISHFPLPHHLYIIMYDDDYYASLASRDAIDRDNCLMLCIFPRIYFLNFDAKRWRLFAASSIIRITF